MNRLITFEGVDGSGKSTQIRYLCEKFTQMGVEYISIREPGSTRISETIRNILLDRDNMDLCSESESLLFMAARAQITHEVIQPALEGGKYVICDRFTDSTIAYQGYGRGLELETLNRMNSYATRGIIPRITFILDIDLETSLKRRDAVGADRMESGGIDFLSRVIKGYHAMSKEDSRFIIVDGNRSPEYIFQIVWEKITKTYGELND